MSMEWDADSLNAMLKNMRSALHPRRGNNAIKRISAKREMNS